MLVFALSTGLPTIGYSQASPQAAPTTPQNPAGIVKDITFKGNKYETINGLQAVMQTKAGKPYRADQLDSDMDALYNLGVFQARPTSVVTPNTDGSFSITVIVVENPVIKEIRVVGNTIISTQAILKAISLKPGQIFSTLDANKSADSIRALYFSKGYSADIGAFGYLPDSPQTLNIQLVENKVTLLTITGANHTRPSTLSRLIHTEKGQLFNINTWRADLKRMSDTRWFDSITDAEPKPGANPGEVDLTPKVHETHTSNLGIGVQVDPQSSFAGFTRYTDSNFKGTGQSISGGFTQGTRGGGASVDLGYGNRFLDHKDTNLTVNLYSHLIYRFTGNIFGGTALNTTTSQYYERHTGGEIGLSRPFTDQLTGSIATRLEGVKTAGVENTDPSGFIQQDGTIGSVTFGLTRDRRDLTQDASRGDFLSLSVAPGYSDITQVGGVLANQSYIGSSIFSKYSFDYRKYFSPERARTLDDPEAPRHVLAFWLRGGTILGRVPFFEQYFAGGSNTIRGYDEDRFWGSNTFIGTVEYRNPIQRGFNAIFFVDYGGAWGGYGNVNNFYQNNHFRLHLGFGPGLSFKTPLGPIRLDFGIGERRATRFHFMIGTSF